VVLLQHDQQFADDDHHEVDAVGEVDVAAEIGRSSTW
jgi:hypothetical protein